MKPYPRRCRRRTLLLRQQYLGQRPNIGASHPSSDDNLLQTVVGSGVDNARNSIDIVDCSAWAARGEKALESADGEICEGFFYS